MSTKTVVRVRPQSESKRTTDEDNFERHVKPCFASSRAGVMKLWRANTHGVVVKLENKDQTEDENEEPTQEEEQTQGGEPIGNKESTQGGATQEKILMKVLATIAALHACRRVIREVEASTRFKDFLVNDIAALHLYNSGTESYKPDMLATEYTKIRAIGRKIHTLTGTVLDSTNNKILDATKEDATDAQQNELYVCRQRSKWCDAFLGLAVVLIEQCNHLLMTCGV